MDPLLQHAPNASPPKGTNPSIKRNLSKAKKPEQRSYITKRDYEPRPPSKEKLDPHTENDPQENRKSPHKKRMKEWHYSMEVTSW